MAIAKGRTNREAERDMIIQELRDLINVVKQSKEQNDEKIKAQLYDIVSEVSISEEELQTRKSPLIDVLSEIEETHIRIRHIILIGIFSFWELSIKDILQIHDLTTTNKSKKSNLRKCINSIYGDVLPEKISIMDGGLRELRNYYTHGDLKKNKDLIIQNLIKHHPEFGITKSCSGYYLNSYSGVEAILNFVIEALHDAESIAVATNKTSNIK